MRKVIFLIAVMLIFTTILASAEEIKLTAIVPKSSCLWTQITNATSGNNDIYNSNNGNVGIGTTSPNYKLDVAGNTHVSSVLDVGP